jgi:hypothetical protein
LIAARGAAHLSAARRAAKNHGRKKRVKNPKTLWAESLRDREPPGVTLFPVVSRTDYDVLRLNYEMAVEALRFYGHRGPGINKANVTLRMLNVPVLDGDRHA